LTAYEAEYEFTEQEILDFCHTHDIRPYAFREIVVFLDQHRQLLKPKQLLEIVTGGKHDSSTTNNTVAAKTATSVRHSLDGVILSTHDSFLYPQVPEILQDEMLDCDDSANEYHSDYHLGNRALKSQPV